MWKDCVLDPAPEDDLVLAQSVMSILLKNRSRTKLDIQHYHVLAYGVKHCLKETFHANSGALLPCVFIKTLAKVVLVQLVSTFSSKMLEA